MSRLMYRALLLLFALLIGAVAALMINQLAGTVRQAIDAQHWEPVSARVESMTPADERRSVPATVTYRYEFDGKSYTSSRLGMAEVNAAASVDGWESGWMATLTVSQTAGTPVVAYVNPRQPRQAVLDRRLRGAYLLNMVPLILFPGGLAALLVWVAVDVGSSKSPGTVASAGASIGAENSATRGLAVAAFLWCSIAFPVAASRLPGMVSAGEWGWVVFIAVLVLVGVWLCGETALTWLDRRLHGNPVFVVDATPRAGGLLTGHVRFGRPAPAGATFELAVTCEQRRFAQSTGTATRKVWKFLTLWSQRVEATADADGTLALQLGLPTGLPGTLGAEGDDFRIVWQLALRGAGMVPFDRTFTLPVDGPAPALVTSGFSDSESAAQPSRTPARWIPVGVAGLLIALVALVALTMLARDVSAMVIALSGHR